MNNTESPPTSPVNETVTSLSASDDVQQQLNQSLSLSKETCSAVVSSSHSSLQNGNKKRMRSRSGSLGYEVIEKFDSEEEFNDWFANCEQGNWIM